MKNDFIGKRAQSRKFLTSPDRKKLVGLFTEDSQLVLPDGAQAVDGFQEGDQLRVIGYVTSTYFSPTLGRSIALALVEGGLDRIGDIIELSVGQSTFIKAEIVDPVFYDPEGNKQHV